MSAARNDLKLLNKQYEAYIGPKILTSHSGETAVDGKLTQDEWRVRFIGRLHQHYVREEESRRLMCL